jgi:hypothetical protein
MTIVLARTPVRQFFFQGIALSAAGRVIHRALASLRALFFVRHPVGTRPLWVVRIPALIPLRLLSHEVPPVGLSGLP